MVDLKKNSLETLRIEAHEFRGHPLFSLRIYIPDKETGELTATRKGVTLSTELLEPVVEALSALLAQKASGALGDVFREKREYVLPPAPENKFAGRGEYVPLKTTKKKNMEPRGVEVDNKTGKIIRKV